MDSLINALGAGGGLAGVGTTVWNVITTRNNKEMLQRQEEKIDEIKDDLADHKTEVAKNYIPVQRFENMESKLDKIYDHLISK